MVKSSFNAQKVIKIIQSWISHNQEGILCQRHPENKITFFPIAFESFESHTITFFIQQPDIIRDLSFSRDLFRTASILTHFSPKADPTKNRGMLFIGRLVNWKVVSKLELNNIPNTSIFNSSTQPLKVVFEAFKVSFWSGIAFGRYSWSSIPMNVVNGFEKKKYLPRFKYGKKISQSEKNILSNSQVLIVATITTKGVIHATPVDFIAINNRLLFATSFYSAKFKAFKKSNIFLGFTYPIKDSQSVFSSSLTISGSSFAYGWNFITSIAYNVAFFPYLSFVVFWMYRKYPRTFFKLPFKSTTLRWQFMPFIARTFTEIFWQSP